MRVAIDARELCGRPTGVGRYLASLLDAWTSQRAGDRHQITLIAHQPIAAAQRWPYVATIVNGSGGTAWEQLTLSAAAAGEHADVFFAPGYTAPLTVSAPVVLTIHDVSYFAHPEWFSWREGFRRRWFTARSARRAAAVITDTAFSKDEIARHLGVTARVIPLGIDRDDDGSADRALLARAGRADDRAPTVLYVGSLFQRRRVDRLIAAFDLVADRIPAARLEIIGENRTRPHVDFDALARTARHADRIHIRSYVDDATLRTLYGQASVFAFLSEYEGFGLTPLEALARGVAPILLDTAVARETCGAAARYVAPDASNEHLAATIADLLASPQDRARLLAHGEAVLARYEWAQTASATWAVLEEAARGR